MQTPGKPVHNPFSTRSAKPANLTGNQPGMTHAGLQEGMITGQRPAGIQKPGFRPHRGISKLSTESRLAEISMKRATGWSVALHVLSPVALTGLVLAILLLLSILMNWNFWDLFKAKTPPADLEFSLVNDTQAKPPEKPLFKGNHNQRAGGERKPDQPIKPVENPPSAPARKVDATAPKVDPQPKPQPVAEKPPIPEPPKPHQEKPAPKADFKPTVSTAKAPEPEESSKQPVKKSGTAAGTIAAPNAPQLASIGESFSGSGLGNPSLSNPQGGPGTPGADVMEDVDFGPFMADLEKRIKRNWMPPRGSESRRVKLLFYLKRDGQVVKIETATASGDDEADRAAIAAVQASAPFMPFPPQVKEDVLPVEFTFDYNVLNPRNAKRGQNR